MPKINEVTAGKPNVVGAVFRAPLGTVLPNDAKTALIDAYKDLGYVSEDGVTNTNSPESENIKAWGGEIVYTSQTEKNDEFVLTLISSLNVEVLKTIYGDNNVTESDGLITVKATSDEQVESVYVIDMILRNGALKRIVIPDGKITEIGDVTYKDDEVTGYELTITGLSLDGVTHYEYITLAE